jgi:hypothetical protein
MSLEINTFCPECENGIFLSELPKAGLIPCKRCGKGREAEGKGKLSQDGSIARCGLCGCEEFYRLKDFNTKLGLWTVVLIFALALIFEKWFFPILIAGAVLDLALYFLLPDVVECYKCKAVYRGLPFSPDHKGFDLAIHDKYAFNKKSRAVDKNKEETHD